MNNTSAQTEPFLTVPPSRPKAVRSIVGSLAFLLVSLLIAAMPFGSDEGLTERIAHALAAYGGPPIFALFLVWSIVQFFSKKPVLVFDERGITTRPFSLIPWSEIAEVRLVHAMNRRCFGVIPRDIEALASHFPEPAANNLRFNYRKMSMAAGVAEQALPMKVEQLLAQVQDYSARQIQEHS